MALVQTYAFSLSIVVVEGPKSQLLSYNQKLSCPGLTDAFKGAHDMENPNMCNFMSGTCLVAE